MRFSRGARLSIGALLLLSLGGKAAFSRAAPAPRGEDTSVRASRLLADQGYATSVEKRPFGTIVHAARGACRLIAAEYPAHGTLTEPLAALAAPIGPLRFVWRGAIYEQAPKLAPLADFYLQRELRRAGFSPAHAPILAYATSRRCGARPVEWGALAAPPPELRASRSARAPA